MIGIYGFENKLTHKWYIGQSVDIHRRYNQHINYRPSKYKTFSYYLHEIGIDNFNFVILKECTKEELNKYEEYYIKYYNSYLDGYNKTKGGSSYPGTYICSDSHRDNLKKSWTEERKRKASIIQKEVQRRYFDSYKGKENAKKHSEFMTGRKTSDETKRKISESLKGHITTQETRYKLSKSNRGKKRSEISRLHMSEAHKGKIPSNKGVNMSEEQKQLLSIKLKEYYKIHKCKIPANKGKHKVWNEEHTKFHYE